MHNIVLFATNDTGGAGKAALRVIQALNRNGKNCKLLVKNKLTNDKDVIKISSTSKFRYEKRIKNVVNRRRLKNIKLDNEYYFGYKYDDIPYMDIVNLIDFIPDLVIVTWITGFISPETISQFVSYYKSTLAICPMDMSPFTGGCHYSWSCKGYEQECQNCPAILSKEHEYIAIDRLGEKKKYWRNANAEYWACSTGLYEEIIKSSLAKDAKIKRMLVPIDENVYNSKNRSIAKNIFNLSPTDKIILFGSSFSYERRKGIEFLVKTLKYLHTILSIRERSDVKVLIAGRKESVPKEYNIPFDVVSIDFISDEILLSHLYQAADVLVSPTIQDSGPMMVNEAQMCGLPVVSFDVGVAADLIVNAVSGYICEVGNTEQMARGIKDVLFNENKIDNVLISKMAFNKTSFTVFSSLIK